ncbi:MAG: thermonuclease family protein [Sandaracinaceae bacterium]|nr:thermonuclease family protein [Sandaracinaceae bacterium]MDW8245710.1 thermonuclease family protein [Sandaracinaceae bacterium]
MKGKIATGFLGLMGAWLIALTGLRVEAEAWSRVFLNGIPIPVSFNDGDSFRIQAGEYQGSQCRLAGFNALESFGPAHQWGSWHPYELYVIAKMATLRARRGVWHCFTEGKRDGYGRLLVECPDLVVSMLREGLAHAYQPDDTPARPEYLRAQQEAIREGRGMWAHGVPAFVMTSLHSATEDPGKEWHYDRLISTNDGHSESRKHRNIYQECQWVCNDEVVADAIATRAVAREMRESASLSPLLKEWSNLHLIEFASRFSRTGELPAYLEGPARDPVLRFLEAARAAGKLGEPTLRRGSCMLYVDFHRRYGLNRAPCLNGHGTLPPGVPDHWSH